jgi:KUP system potassium uptake protein
VTLPTIVAETPCFKRSGHTAMALASLGVVFGDIGTSPLYTLKTVLATTGNHPSATAVLGSLSLIVWTLIIITTVKYVSLAMRVDNDGEGGILALMSLLGVKHGKRPLIVAVGLLGAALIYGDGAITPAISLLSAPEGLDIAAAPSFRPFVLPAVAILLTLFGVQRLGTARIGTAFRPVMATWFLIIALLGIGGITKHPTVAAGTLRLTVQDKQDAVVAGKLGTPPYRPRGIAAEARRPNFAAPPKSNLNRRGDVRIVTDVPVQHPGVQGGRDRLTISVEG